MSYYNQDFLRLATQERLDQRVREGEAERLASEINQEPVNRSRLASALRRVRLSRRRVGEPRLET